MFGDFKKERPDQFYFVFWIIGFDAVYILLIFSLQSIPILQCLSIIILVLLFIRYSDKIKPFEKKTLTFMHFFNFSCILVAGFMNLILAIIDTVNPNFSGVETQGWFVTSVIILNTSTNVLVSLGGMMFQIYYKLKNRFKDHYKKVTINSPSSETVPQDMNIRSYPSLREIQRSLPDDLVIQNIADPDNKQQDMNIRSHPSLREIQKPLPNDLSIQNIADPENKQQDMNNRSHPSLREIQKPLPNDLSIQNIADPENKHQDMNIRSPSSPRELQKPLPNDLLIENLADPDNNQSISQPVRRLLVIKIRSKPTSNLFGEN